MTVRRFRIGVLAIAAVCLFGLNAAKADLLTGLVAHWSFDEGFDATTGGPAYDGTAYNGASITTAPGTYKFGGGAASFSRAAEQYAHINPSPFTGNEYTYSAWVYLNLADIPADDRLCALEAGDDAGGNYAASLGFRDLGDGDIVQAYTHTIGTDGGAAQASFASHQAWHNVTVTAAYDAPNNETTLTLYMDGVAIATNSDVIPSSLSPTTHLNIGSYRGGDARYWDGYIDDVGVWNRVLSSTEIAALQSNAIPTPEPNTCVLGVGGIIGLLAYAWRKRK